MKGLAILMGILLYIAAALVIAWAALVRPNQHPMMIDAEFNAPLIAPCPLDRRPKYPNPPKPKQELDA